MKERDKLTEDTLFLGLHTPRHDRRRDGGIYRIKWDRNDDIVHYGRQYFSSNLWCDDAFHIQGNPKA